MMCLTHLQADLLAYIKRFIAENNGAAPSFEDMREAMGIASKSGVHRLVSALEERGHIRRLPNRARAIEIIAPEPPLEALAAYSSHSLLAELSRRGAEKRAA